ncbi:hypothetical protein MRX96_014770 [Rhipicephalus microplus]
MSEDSHSRGGAKPVVAERVLGIVKWFNVKERYGFITRSDTREDIFVHQTAIARNYSQKAPRSVGDGELVEFAIVVGDKGLEAANVTGPGGEPVQGSPYAVSKRRSRPGRNRRRRGRASREGSTCNDPQMLLSVGEGEIDEFDVDVSDDGNVNANCRGGGVPAQGKPCAPLEHRFKRRRNKRRREPASRGDFVEDLSVGDVKMVELDVVTKQRMRELESAKGNTVNTSQMLLNVGEMGEFDVVVRDNDLEYVNGRDGGEPVQVSSCTARERRFQPRRNKRKREPASRGGCGENLGVGEGEMNEFGVLIGDNGLEYITGFHKDEPVHSYPSTAGQRHFQPCCKKQGRGPASPGGGGENSCVAESEMDEFDVVVGDNGLEYITGFDDNEPVESNLCATRKCHFQPHRKKQGRGLASPGGGGKNPGVGEGNMDEFDVVIGDNGLEYITGFDDDEPVQSNPCANRKRRFQHRRKKQRRGPASQVGYGKDLRDEASILESPRPQAQQQNEHEGVLQRWMTKGLGRPHNNRRFRGAPGVLPQTSSPAPRRVVVLNIY